MCAPQSFKIYVFHLNIRNTSYIQKYNGICLSPLKQYSLLLVPNAKGQAMKPQLLYWFV